MTNIGRPPSCVCGTCKKCQRAAYMREWYRRTTEKLGKPATGNRDPGAARRNDTKRSGSEKRRASLRANSARMRTLYPEKIKARNAVGHALRNGKLIRQPCRVCGNPRSEAHHPDYSQPLVVEWFCRPDHKALHR